MFKSTKEILAFIKEKKVEFVDFRFTDTIGSWQHITYKSNHVDQDILTKGVGFDGSSIQGWKDIHESDMVLLPDISTAFLDCFSSHLCMIIFCDVIDPKTNEGYIRDPRAIARKAEDLMMKSGIADAAFFGPELEFFIFDDVRFKVEPNKMMHTIDSEEGPYNSYTKYDSGNLAHRPDYKRGYFPVQPVDPQFDLRSEMVEVMESFGLETTLHHHEVASSQAEIGFKFSTLIQTADNVQKFEYAVKNVATHHGKTATFMPKPIYGDNGSGMHTHQSLWKNNKSLFFKKGGYADLSEIALYYIGGIIKHEKTIHAFANPTTNSYKRLVLGYEAPVYMAYSAKNRSAAIRIPHVHSDKAKRIEARFPDPTANPYLAFTAMLMAGIDGIKNKIHPGEAADKNLYHLSEKESKKLPTVARSLREALENLDKNRGFLKAGGVFSDEFIDSYIELKLHDVQTWENVPHPVEFKMYYSS